MKTVPEIRQALGLAVDAMKAASSAIAETRAAARAAAEPDKPDAEAKAVAATKGAVRLTKMNIDDHPQIAGQLGIQSIPAVIAFDKGQPVDGFVGALPESQIKAFVERIAGKMAGGVKELLDAAAQVLAAGDVVQAIEAYGAVLEEDPGSEEHTSELQSH